MVCWKSITIITVLALQAYRAGSDSLHRRDGGSAAHARRDTASAPARAEMSPDTSCLRRPHRVAPESRSRVRPSKISVEKWSVGNPCNPATTLQAAERSAASAQRAPRSGGSEIAADPARSACPTHAAQARRLASPEFPRRFLARPHLRATPAKTRRAEPPKG